MLDNMDFTSENTSPVHPMVVDAVAKATAGFALNLEREEQHAKAIQTINQLFDTNDLAAFRVLIRPTANAVALGAIFRPYTAILCHPQAPNDTDETRTT